VDASVLIWLIVLFAVLLWVKRWLGLALQRVGMLYFGSYEAAIGVYYIVLLPGVILHEVSHWLAANLLGVRTRGMTLLPQIRRGAVRPGGRRPNGGMVQLGSVNVHTSDPIRESLIGVAPLLTGVAAILLLARWRFAVAPSAPPLEFGAVARTLSDSLQTPDALLWLYLLFSISNAMLPSESDRQPWLPALVFVGLFAASVYVTGVVRQIPPAVRSWFLLGAKYLVFVFGLATALDIPVGLLLLILEKVGEVLLGRRVEFRE
jgi:hypothetical protein